MKRATLAQVASELLRLEKGAGDGQIDLGSDGVLNVTSLAKEMYPDTGATKGAVMRYYTSIWPFLAPAVKDRALVLKRYPAGVAGPMFFQQNAGDHLPAGVRTELVDSEAEGRSARLVGGDLLTQLYCVQLGAVEVHTWMSRVATIDSADRCLIDLDPGDDVPFTDVTRLARELLRVMDACGLAAGIKTSGSSGIHLVIPLPPRTSYDTSQSLAMRISQTVATQHPELATVERTIRARPRGTIYVDALQNARGKSMATAYSLRATALATASAPIARSELTARLRTERYTMKNLPKRAAEKGDLWERAMREKNSGPVVRRAIDALSEALDP